MSQRAQVAVERVHSYETEPLEAGLQAVLGGFGGWERLIRHGDRVLVKPNCISPAPPSQPAQTHPAVILAVCRQLLDCGAKPFVGDSPAWGSLTGNLRQLDILHELAHLGVPVVEFKNPVKARNEHGRVFHELSVDRAAIEADAIVNLPKFKSHRQLLLTVAIKNMFGCVTGRRKAWWHLKAGGYENYFGRMLVEVFDMLRPRITIIDAVTAMEGKGPVSGTARQMNLLLASTDGPALERVAADLVGIKPAQLRTLAAARELSVGTPYLEAIDVLGPALKDLRIPDFQLPPLMPIGFSIPRLVKGAFKNAWIVHQQTRGATAAS